MVWPATGETQLFRDVQAGQAIEIVEGRDEYVVMKYDTLVLGS